MAFELEGRFAPIDAQSPCGNNTKGNQLGGDKTASQPRLELTIDLTAGVAHLHRHNF